MDWFIEAIRSTAWTITPPPAYGLFHLGFTFVGFAISFFAAWKLRNLGKKGNKILLFCMGFFLMLTEVYKQLFYYFHVGDGSYCWWIFPFQLCSVPMYLCVIAPFIKNEKIQKKYV